MSRECVPVETVVGTLYVREDQLVIGRFLQADGKPPTETEARAFIAKWVKPGDSAIDVGCNVGFFTIFLAELVGPEGEVLALDPNIEVLECLRETRHERPDLKRRIDFICIAAGAEDGRGWVERDPRGDGGNRIRVGPLPRHADPVHVVKLDAMTHTRRPVSFVKIDAEGMDHEVLQGARAILAEDRPVVLFEHNPEQIAARGQDEDDVLRSLLDLGLDVDYGLRGLDGNLPRVLAGDLALIPKEKL